MGVVSMPPSSFNLLTFLVFTFIFSSSISSGRHTISIPSGVSRPSSFGWDPMAQHFVVGSSSSPSIFSVSDAGVAEIIASFSENVSSVGICIDDRRRRLLVAVRSPSAVAAYDLRSWRPHRLIFLSALPSSPAGGIAVDPASGLIFVAGSNAAAIWTVDSEGAVSDLSRSAAYGGEGFAGVARLGQGFLLAVQGRTHRVFKVDEESGAAKEVTIADGNLVPEEATGVVVMAADGSAVIAGVKGARLVKSEDGWAEAAARGHTKLEEGGKCQAVAVREGRKIFLLVTPEKEEDGGGRIEEVEWEVEQDMLWVMLLLGFGFAYFLYWRFQMTQLVSNFNKKRH